MLSATTQPLDPLQAACEPPPVPVAASRRKRKRRHATLPPDMHIDMWCVEQELGRGGMATVYAVVQARSGKQAALKLAHRAVLGPRFTPETFLREARTARLIAHPGIPEVFATGTYDGRPYLTMERLSGQSLGARLEKAMAHDETLEILIELCDVLAAAHAAGVTHRDLKLDNVFLLDVPGADGRRIKLLDWGMARIAGEDDPLRGLIAGTLTYVAPEQARGDEVTPAADVYALAVLTYQLLLGAPPFASPNDLELIQKHLYEPPPAPSTLCRGIPPELEATLVAMLAKRPEQRPALGDVVRVLTRARAQLRAGELRAAAPAGAPPRDRLGPLGLPLLVTAHDRAVGTALALAFAVTSLLQLLSA
jgi:serine/threonine-protein kinase